MRKLVRLALLAVGLGLLPSQLPAIAATEAPRAVFASTTHDFGAVKQGAKVVHRFTLRNEGSAMLRIDRAALMMPGMDIEVTSRIGPGEAGKVTLGWDTSRIAGDVDGKAILYLNDPAQPQVTLVLRGVVTPPIDFIPFAAVFFSVFQKETAERSITIINNEERPLAITRLEPEGEHFAASLETVESGKVYKLRVTVPPGVPPGRYREAVYLHTDHPMRSRLRVAVNVFVKADLYASWEVVDFGRVSLDQLKRNPALLDLLTQTFMVKKREGDFAITSVESDLPFLQISQSPTGRSWAFRIDVGLIVERLQPGKIEGSVRIRTDDKDFPEIVVSVRGEIR